MLKVNFISPTGGETKIVKSVNGLTGEVVLTAADVGAATEEYVAVKIAEAQLAESDVDLSGYYTKSETDKAITNAIDNIDFPETDLSDYATKNYVEQELNKIEVPSLEGYATENFVNQEIAKATLGGEVDLSGYYTKTETDAAIKEAVEAVEVPEAADLTGYATEKYVDTAISNIEHPTTDLSNYYTKSEVDSKIPDVSGYTTMSAVEDKGYQTAAQVETAINTALGVIENGSY